MSPIVFAPVFPWWLIVLLFLLGLVLSLIQFRLIRDRLGQGRAAILAALRLGTFLLVIAVALNPSAVVRKEQRVAPALAVLVDTSQSMGRSASPGEPTRLDEARALLTQGFFPLLGSLAEKFDVTVYGLAGAGSPLAAGDLALLKAGGNKGDLGQALTALAGKNAAVLLLSDGNLPWPEGQAPELPVIAVPVGNQSAYRDVLIKEVKAPAMAFRGRETVIDATIKSYGYQGLTLPVLLKDGASRLAAGEIRLPAGSGEATVSLTFVPDQEGRQNLSLVIPGQAGEQMAANNQLNFSVKVVRDKIRVLMVTGNPGLNYRFLRTALKSDPSLDLLSFVILRTPSDILNVPTQEQSLIPFPMETLFVKELAGFDLVIFDNFDYSLFLRPAYLENLRNFVRAGGSFAMIGGPNLFHEGPNGFTPIGDLLPIRFAAKELYRRDAPVRVRVSKMGGRHPILRIGDDLPGEGDTQSLWREMSPLDGINVMDAKKSATVLLESTEGIPWPILTVADFGKGRVLFLATDYAWKWYMGMVAGGKGNQPYMRLVHRMVRWLTKDPGLEPLQVILPERVAIAGQEMAVKIQTAAPDPSRGPETAVSFSVINPEGVKIPSQLQPTQQPGEYRVFFRPEKGGIYRLKAETPLRQVEESLAVAGPQDRFDAAPDHDQLKRIAAATGGKYVLDGEGALRAVAEYALPAEKRYLEEERWPLWATPGAMAVILALLSAEWYYRRRWGLV